MLFKLAAVSCLAALSAIETRADILVGSWQSRDIRRYSDTGVNLGTFVAAGTGGLVTPDGLAYGPDGNLYVSSAEQAAVLRFNGQTGAFMDVFASQGLARAGYLAFGPDGYLYVTSAPNNQVVRFDATTGAFVDVFATSPTLSFPAGLAWSGNRMFVSSFQGNQVLSFDAATGAPLGVLTGSIQPLYLRIAGPDEMHIAEYGGNRVRRVSISSGSTLGVFSNPQLNGPVGLLAMPDGTQLVTSWNNGRILRFSASGTFLSTFASDYQQPNDIVYMPVPTPGIAAMCVSWAGVLVSRRRR